MSTKDKIRETLQQCESLYANLQESSQQVRDEMARQRLQSAMTNMEACINDCRSAIDNV